MCTWEGDILDAGRKMGKFGLCIIFKVKLEKEQENDKFLLEGRRVLCCKDKT